MLFTILSAPAASFSPNMTVLSQVLALPSDTANDGQTRLSVPKHSQTSQEVRKTRFDWSQVSSWGLAAGGEALSIIVVHCVRSEFLAGAFVLWENMF